MRNTRLEQTLSNESPEGTWRFLKKSLYLDLKLNQTPLENDKLRTILLQPFDIGYEAISLYMTIPINLSLLDLRSRVYTFSLPFWTEVASRLSSHNTKAKEASSIHYQ